LLGGSSTSSYLADDGLGAVRGNAVELVLDNPRGRSASPVQPLGGSSTSSYLAGDGLGVVQRNAVELAMASVPSGGNAVELVLDNPREVDQRRRSSPLGGSSTSSYLAGGGISVVRRKRCRAGARQSQGGDQRSRHLPPGRFEHQLVPCWRWPRCCPRKCCRAGARQSQGAISVAGPAPGRFKHQLVPCWRWHQCCPAENAVELVLDNPRGPTWVDQPGRGRVKQLLPEARPVISN